MIDRIGPDVAPDPEAERRRTAYEALRQRHGAERDRLGRRWNLLGNARLVLAALAAILWVAAYRQDSLALVVAGGLVAAGFLGLVLFHRRVGMERRRAAAQHDINAEALLRIDRAWDRLPLRDAGAAPAGHPFAGDLDLLGHASLEHLLQTTETAMGDVTLRRWLLAPAPLTAAHPRQRAVQKLAPELGWRQELATRGRLIGTERPDPEPFLHWAEGAPLVVNRPVIAWLARLTAVMVVIAVVGALIGIVSWAAMVPLLVLNIVLTQVIVGGARERLDLVAVHYRSIAQYAQLLAQIEAMPGESAGLMALRDRLATDGAPASRLLGRLGARAAWAVPAGSLLYYPLQALFAWDVNVLAALERWQVTAGRHVRDWLATIGEAEALAALAGLAHDNPSWVFPDLDAAADHVAGKDVGHPLLPAGIRVTNDAEIGPPGTFLLVTGSNMSGKSTLLRALGVNVVLAGAGGPVCAAAFRCPPVRLWTSVRVEDSLERGVSFFMAELQRLKQVVAAGRQPGDRIFFLLDEILQGTNTAERQIAARRIIRHLVDGGAIGAVSTHDLTLAEGPELAPIVRPVHLRDTVTATGLAFDYRVRPGIATSTNALRLMDIVFADVPVSGQAAAGVAPAPDPLPQGASSGSNGRTTS